MKKVLFYALTVPAAIVLISGSTGCDPDSDAVRKLRRVPLNQTGPAKAHRERYPVLNLYSQVLAHEDLFVWDTVVLTGQSFELVGIIRGGRYFKNSGIDYTRDNILLVGSDRNQPCLFYLSNRYCRDGDLTFHFTEIQR